MVTLQEWKWIPNNMSFHPQLQVHTPMFGKQVHGHGSAYWMFSMQLPPVNEEKRAEIDVFRAQAGGASIVEFYDVRRPVPYFYRNAEKSMVSQIVPNVTIKGMSKSDETLTINGVADDVISVGDPISFVHNDIRHYFKSKETKKLTGSDETLSVMIRPRMDLSSLSIVADRIKPKCRFTCAFNDMGGQTNVHGLTVYSLTGIEYTKAITA